MKITHGLSALRTALATSPVVNLVGGLGSGKSALARRLPLAAAVDLCGLSGAGAAARLRAPRPGAAPAGGLLLIDSVDGPARAESVAAALDACTRPVLLVSRRPLRSSPGWAEHAPVTVSLDPWPPGAVEEQVRATGLADAEAVALAVRLSGGLPLVAELACRELLAGTPADAPGAVADAVAEEVLRRLGREDPRIGGRHRHALRLLATVRAGDERLLTGGPDLFSALAGLSLVRREPLGLAVREPYRSLFELAYAWRRPEAHQSVRKRAAGYRQALLADRRDPREQARLVEQGLFLSGEPVLRRSLFPPVEDSALIRPAGPAEADDIGRLMHRWAVRSGFDARRSERITERWLAAGPASFHMARDRDGRAVALAALVPVGSDTADGIEPLLQQHAGDLLVPRGAGQRAAGGPAVSGPATSGLFLGAAYGADAGVHAQMLRHILVQATLAGHLVVSTASQDYQHLLRTLSFRPHGGIRDDVYRCGRRPEVYSQDFTGVGLSGWMRRLGPGAAPGPGADLPALVGRALAHLREPGRLAESPLIGLPGLDTAQSLRGWLEDGVAALAGAEAAADADAEAGAILAAYYLGRPRTHHQIARSLHLSRATYFRRLRHGLALLAARLPG
ncbi:hypothetical protein [Streptomyces sp. NPDC048603]|uniref:hypothetical protein n=1 Tax=Streptomyces sp. NPDC048603 TaxID=3365577 RepID=UPI003716725B